MDAQVRVHKNASSTSSVEPSSVVVRLDFEAVLCLRIAFELSSCHEVENATAAGGLHKHVGAIEAFSPSGVRVCWARQAGIMDVGLKCR